jgi:hypothetical protein
MQSNPTTFVSSWPTLEGRLSHPLRSREEAVRQLQTMMPITPLAKHVLKSSRAA